MHSRINYLGCSITADDGDGRDRRITGQSE